MSEEETGSETPAIGRRGTFREQASARYSYGLVLVLILWSVAWSAGAGDSKWALAVTVALQGATVLLALRTSDASLRARRIAGALVGVAVAGALVSLIVDQEVSRGMVGIVNGLLVAGIPVVIVRGVVRQLRAERAVTLQTVFGVLCVYLLLGLFFASIYTAAAAIGSEPFFAQGIDGTRQNHLYFSFVTLATVGYGDFTAASNLGRTLAMTEAILGQLYLVTAVSLVVGNLGRRATAPTVR